VPETNKKRGQKLEAKSGKENEPPRNNTKGATDGEKMKATGIEHKNNDSHINNNAD
jgi:hypothetical protein